MGLLKALSSIAKIKSCSWAFKKVLFTLKRSRAVKKSFDAISRYRLLNLVDVACPKLSWGVMNNRKYVDKYFLK
jgi:hypothetical protein